MELTVVSQERAESRSSEIWGDLRQDSALFDLIRAEVTARRICPRWAVLKRIGGALGEDAECRHKRLSELCSVLEFEGDIVPSSGGMVNASPVRAIKFDDNAHRIVCSLPSAQLRAWLPGKLETEGQRRIHRFGSSAEADAAIKALGGVIMSSGAWAGLNLSPIADQRWLDSIDQRLTLRPEAAGSLERDVAVEWKCLTFGHTGSKWSRSGAERSRLWRARSFNARWIWAWASEGSSPSNGDFVKLDSDEANRTLFALGRQLGHNVEASVERDQAVAYLRLGEWLPRAEYRYVSSVATLSRIQPRQQSLPDSVSASVGGKPRSVRSLVWSVPLASIDEVCDTLGDRLGLDIEEISSR